MSRELFTNETSDVSWFFDTWMTGGSFRKDIAGLRRDTKSVYMDDETAPTIALLWATPKPSLTSSAMMVRFKDGGGIRDIASTTWERFQLYIKKHDLGGGGFESNAGAKMKREFGDYNSARKVARELRNGNLGNNTWIFERPNESGGVDVVVILHSTAIVTYHEDDSVTLNSGGYRTVTTKARMNEVLPPGISVSQKNRNWFVHTRSGVHRFYDGMRILPDGGRTAEYRGNPRRNGIHVDIHSHNRPRRNPGKFANTVEELLYGIDHDQTVGSVQEDGYWYGLVSGLLLPEAKEQAAALGIDADEFANDVDEYDWPLNAIITEDDAGFIEVYPFKLNKQAMESWRKIIRDFDTKLEDR